MVLIEQETPRVERPFIKPGLVMELAEKALHEGVSFADNVVKNDVLARMQNQLTGGEMPEEKLRFGSTASKRLENALLQRNKLDVPLEVARGYFMGNIYVPAPTAARVVEEIHRGLITVAKPQTDNIKLDPAVLHYDPHTPYPPRQFAKGPHIDASFRYFQAILTVYGTADFYYSRDEGEFDPKKGFQEEPGMVTVKPGTLVIIRGSEVAAGPPMAHAVSLPKNEDRERLAIAVSYLSSVSL